MLSDSQLNVYIVGDNLSPRQRVQLQAQLDSALRALPQWCLDLVRAALERTGARNFPLVIEPQPPGGDALPLSLGHIEGRPSAYLRPRLEGDRIEWPQDRRFLVAKAAAYVCAPPRDEASDFWRRWAEAIAADALRDKAAAAHEAWAGASDPDLLIEMFAAYALSPDHERWAGLPSVRGFLDGWRSPSRGRT
jgi:hypothetical protein